MKKYCEDCGDAFSLHESHFCRFGLYDEVETINPIIMESVCEAARMKYHHEPTYVHYESPIGSFLNAALKSTLIMLFFAASVLILAFVGFILWCIHVM